MNKNLISLFYISIVFSIYSPSFADSEVTIETDVGLVSDYVYRGLSRSDSGWALQGTFTARHNGGVYMGVFMSSLDSDFNRHSVESEFFGGYTFSKGAYDYDLSISYDALMGGAGEGYFETRASISRDFGVAYIKTGIAYTPWDREIGEGNSTYVYSDFDVPLPISNIVPMAVSLHLGYENFEGPLDKWDWGVGIYMEVVGVEFGVKYSDVKDGNPLLSENRLTFNLRKYF
jgi:uncharacterized protein (TIGR02001 family)